MTTPTHENAVAAALFFDELLDSVETLGCIADAYGTRTLCDLMYLQQSILTDGFIDHYPEESKVLLLARCLPSGEKWMTFIKAEVVLHSIEHGGPMSISDDDLCARCKQCDYRPGELSNCGSGWPGLMDPNEYVMECRQYVPT